MGPDDRPANATAQRRWPINHGVRLPDIRVGPAARWQQVRPSPSFPVHVFLLTPVFREARLIFKAGKNHDGYFSAEDLLAQVNSAIEIFEGLSKGKSKGLSLFDNAPSHQKRAPDALSARKMVKGAPPFLFSFIFSHFC